MTHDYMKEDWKTIKSTEIHRNPWYKINQDDILMPSGQVGKYTYINSLPLMIIAALTPRNKIYLVGQYRYPISQFSWELPMGSMEKEDKDFEFAARRELHEEIGVEAEKMQEIGTFYSDNGISNKKAYIFLAEGLTETSSSPDYTEFLTMKKVSLKKLEKMIARNEIIDALTIAAFYRLKLYLKAR